MKNEIPEHKDLLGKTINLTDCVVFPYMNGLRIGTVTKLNPKMVQVKRVGSKNSYGKYNKYSKDLVIVDSQDVTMYLLKAGE